ncbi:MAG: isoaspartyl peptidase/L-asparaginase [Anaerolineae bacterium]|nr:isoaspartyl peptidase/L-asparaginase [Anaerolineae bacterium]
MPLSLIVHGGAGTHRPADHLSVMETCRDAVAAGRAYLQQGGSALDAVEAAVRILEDSPLFNAGYGSVINADGMCEMDAMIMEGERGMIGAVGGVKRLRNPITAARLVMERTPHHFLIAEGAERFAEREGLIVVSPESMIAPHRLSESGDTVGAVALDGAGHVAVAVSTGGLHHKMPGRIGDSPIPGAGGYAEDFLGAACATGVGETIMRSMLTFRAVQMMSAQISAQAVADAVMPIYARFEGDGGLIVVDKQGRVGFAHNTPLMPVAWIDGDEIKAQMSR